MLEFLRKKYGNEKVIQGKNYIYAIGDIPIGLIAHLDIAHREPPNYGHIFHDQEKNALWSPYGLGADDRAGVYAIISIIKQNYFPSVILTCGEEIGGVGANELVKEIKKPLTNLRCLIELDRQGQDDCVFYSCDNAKFQAYVEKFGFITQRGTFSDISIICPCWGLAGTNLSIGYYFEHTESEILFTNILEEVIGKVIKMLKDVPKEKMKYVFAQKAYLNPSTKMCMYCGAEYPVSDMIPILMPDGIQTEYGCVNCIAQLDDEICWCDVCGEAYLPREDGDMNVCPRHESLL